VRMDAEIGDFGTFRLMFQLACRSANPESLNKARQRLRGQYGEPQQGFSAKAAAARPHQKGDPLRPRGLGTRRNKPAIGHGTSSSISYVPDVRRPGALPGVLTPTLSLYRFWSYYRIWVTLLPSFSNVERSADPICFFMRHTKLLGSGSLPQTLDVFIRDPCTLAVREQSI
jgi:hypothetical protein